MRAEQTVSEMVVESLARQAVALSEETGRSFEDAFAEVLKTPAGRRMSELADGPHRHEKAARWQAELLVDREAGRPPTCASRRTRKCSTIGWGTLRGGQETRSVVRKIMLSPFR